MEKETDEMKIKKRVKTANAHKSDSTNSALKNVVGELKLEIKHQNHLIEEMNTTDTSNKHRITDLCDEIAKMIIKIEDLKSDLKLSQEACMIDHSEKVSEISLKTSQLDLMREASDKLQKDIISAESMMDAKDKSYSKLETLSKLLCVVSAGYLIFTIVVYFCG